MVQGQLYQADYLLDPGYDPSARYDIVKVNWSWPTSVVKGYGKWHTVNPGDLGGDPDGPYEVFDGDPDNSENTDVKVLNFTQDDLEQDYSPGDHFDSSFYWGASSVGDLPVSVTATFDKIVNGVSQGTVAVSDSVVINVGRAHRHHRRRNLRDARLERGPDDE